MRPVYWSAAVLLLALSARGQVEEEMLAFLDAADFDGVHILCRLAVPSVPPATDDRSLEVWSAQLGGVCSRLEPRGVRVIGAALRTVAGVRPLGEHHHAVSAFASTLDGAARTALVAGRWVQIETLPLEVRNRWLVATSRDRWMNDERPRLPAPNAETIAAHERGLGREMTELERWDYIDRYFTHEIASAASVALDYHAMLQLNMAFWIEIKDANGRRLTDEVPGLSGSVDRRLNAWAPDEDGVSLHAPDPPMPLGHDTALFRWAYWQHRPPRPLVEIAESSAYTLAELASMMPVWMPRRIDDEFADERLYVPRGTYLCPQLDALLADASGLCWRETEGDPTLTLGLAPADAWADVPEALAALARDAIDDRLPPDMPFDLDRFLPEWFEEEVNGRRRAGMRVREAKWEELEPEEQDWLRHTARRIDWRSPHLWFYSTDPVPELDWLGSTLTFRHGVQWSMAWMTPIGSYREQEFWMRGHTLTRPLFTDLEALYALLR